MKSIGKLLLTTIVIMLCSCQTDIDDPHNTLKSPISIGNYHVGYEFKYNGHKYLEFNHKTAHGATIIHDPDCECNKKN
jgi:hypothetical protein